MGTNYYLRMNICPHCGRYDEVHLGKSSGGWRFMFHGYRDKDDPIKLTNLVNLFKILNTEGIRIFDEYGEEETRQEFLDFVNQKQSEKSQFPSLGTDRGEIDENGFEFYYYDFS